MTFLWKKSTLDGGISVGFSWGKSLWEKSPQGKLHRGKYLEVICTLGKKIPVLMLVKKL